MSGPVAARESASGRVLVVCGLEAEARIARRPDVAVVAGGGDQDRLARDLRRLAPGARGVISFGIAGGLAPGLRPGDAVVATAVAAPDGERLATDRTWTEALLARLAGAASPAVVACADAPVTSVAGKAALRARAGAGADLVDMESHLAGRAAAAAGIPFAVLRVVTDPAGRALPHAAAVGMRPDGGVDLPAIVRSLARHPGQLPGLVRTGLDARRAFAALLRCRQRLGPGFAFGDLA